MLTYRSNGVHTNRHKGKTKVQARDRQGAPAETPDQKKRRERREAMAGATMEAGQGMVASNQKSREAAMNEPEPQMQRPQGRGGVGQALLDKYVYKRGK